MNQLPRTPTFTSLQYSYKKSDSDVWVLNTKDIPVDQELIADQQLIYIPPLAIGGNHKHARTEWFIGIGDMVFFWLDNHNQKFEKHMNPEGHLFLVQVPPFLPHAVKNVSKHNLGILFELANDKMTNPEKIQVI